MRRRLVVPTVFPIVVWVCRSPSMHRPMEAGFALSPSASKLPMIVPNSGAPR